MQQILYDYSLNATTWVYLSSLIMIAVYFKFRRFWSVRNLDLVGLILFAPGMLLVMHGHEMKHLGYLWLFLVGVLFLLRMLVDSAMVRRPLLEPNLSASGLTFACVAMLVFLMSNVIEPAKTGGMAIDHLSETPQAADQAQTPSTDKILKERGPGYPMFHVYSAASDAPGKRATAILAHLAVVLGMVLIGYRHFDNTHTGIAAATLYLLLPYSANFTPCIDHVVPAALLVWAIQSYRRPVFAGIFVGLAAGLIWYPLFLLPLWCSFYWRRGLLRFTLAVLVVLGLMAVSLAFMPSSLGSYMDQFRQTFGIWLVPPDYLRGFWQHTLAPCALPGRRGFRGHVRQHGFMACPEESRQSAGLLGGDHAWHAVLEGL